ncbi:iron-containing alcohol dehydrogenase [Hoeflea poritis]|uniref:Iron-containing alcohol dehydrogenase n=1 Tax=Hoeflea poritis TaxID=2993659 RepID=A0ABT4VTC9_9HYPH|nr:iron-containing alcohol dehydrogenase [Hoeflea poritis]MDA4847960.1 iron-containing alcohol dehydrogenase [Hoeflea poritis]
MSAFAFHTTPQIVVRPGAAGGIAEIAGGKLGQSVLFVTDKGIRNAGLDQSAIRSLEDAGHKVTVFDAVEADPSLDTLMKSVEAAHACGATGVVALGGGSSLDVAKLTALLAGSGEDIDAAWGVGNAKGPRLPLVLIPTTAGTGSEVTPVSIITVDGEEKRGVSSPVILPDAAILDAELTVSLPAPATAATGIDAMVHAIEAYASKNANNNPVSRMLATQALTLLGANIETAVFSPENLEARGAMLLGSTLAGMAFANSPVAAVHALAYPIGGTFHIPHGLSNALVLPEVLRFNAAEPENGSYRLYAELSPYAFADLEDPGGTQEGCAVFIERIAALSTRIGLPQRLREVGIGEEALPKMASDAMKQTRLLVNNPRHVAEDDALAIYRAAW